MSWGAACLRYGLKLASCVLQSDDREEGAREEGGGDESIEQQGLAVDVELSTSWKVVWEGRCD